MMEIHGLNKNSNLYKANFVTWDLSQDENVLEVNDRRYNADKFEDSWDIRGVKNHTVLIKAYKEIFNPNMDFRTVMENNFNVLNILYIN